MRVLDRLGYLLAFMFFFTGGEVAGAITSSPTVSTEAFSRLLCVSLISMVVVFICGVFYQLGKDLNS